MTTKSDGFSRGIVLLALLCAFSFGAIVKVALADSYHVTCVAHGFVGGDSPTDGSFFARIDNGCGSTYRTCSIYSYNTYRGGQTAYGAAICNAWSEDFGGYTECAGSVHVYDQGVFSDHTHTAPNWCL
ncbi:MAG: hypothetical protein JWQ18_1419 [Conexibacter sp.]|nr:hypothetical protein [Conexibacter sp.]